MRHSHDHAVDACSAGLVNDGFKGRDKHFTALQAKTFLWWPLPSQEVFKSERKNRYFDPKQCTNMDTQWTTLKRIQGLLAAANLVDLIKRASKVLLSTSVNRMIPGVSIFWRIHWHWSTLLMNINSTPMWPQ